MSIADHFDHTEAQGFSRPQPLQARRQFGISLALVAVLALAIASVSLGMWHDAALGALASGRADASFAGALSGAIPN